MERMLGVRFEALITKNPDGTINSGDFPILTVGGAAVDVLLRGPIGIGIGAGCDRSKR